ncbi:MAG: hypothetical protein O6916_03630, partial [bacterium]|nr:hypothetical protein [bacterium]
MTGLLILFLVTASILWISLFGYLLALVFFASRRHRDDLGASALPEIAVVVPTLNEEELIL